MGVRSARLLLCCGAALVLTPACSSDASVERAASDFEDADGSRSLHRLKHADGSEDRVACRHTLTDQQIEWFRAGSALAWIGSRGV